MRGLWKMGFRIGESRAPASFFEGTFVAGVKEKRPGMGSIASPYDTARDLIGGRGTSRLSSIEVARRAPSPAPAYRDLPPPSAWLERPRSPGPGLASLRVDRPAAGDPGAPWHVRVWFVRPVPPGAAVRVLWKAFSGFADWADVPASPLATASAPERPASACQETGCAFKANVQGPVNGGYFAVEIAGEPGVGWRYPDVLTTAPYVVVPPRRAGLSGRPWRARRPRSCGG